MKKIKKIIVYVLALALVITSLYITEPNEVIASGTYVIKVSNTNKYLYEKDGKVAVGSLDENNKAFYWLVIEKSDGSYWIQNRETANYICLENQSGTTGDVDVISDNYESWQSGRWEINLDVDTTIKNKWKGVNGYVYLSGTKAVFGTTAQKFSFISKTPASTNDTKYKYTGGAADWIIIPDENSDINSIGATMPYTRYDSEEAVIGGDAVLVESKNFSKDSIASQASEQSYISLPTDGSYAEWTMKTTGNGVTMRFTMPDSEDGRGLDGSVDVYVNDEKVKTIDLTSYYMWQYFPTSSPYDSPEKGGTACFAFDETHFKLDVSLQVGDRIRIQSSGANELEYGVDFLEIEETGEAIPIPENAYDVTDPQFGAIADDGKSDIRAINACIRQAAKEGKDVYFPEGTFNIGGKWTINASDIKITGAGIWYTNIQFTSASRNSGGISGSNANNVEFCNMYINSKLRSRYDENAVYKCFMDVWTGGSYIHDIWEDHFECGFWIADYTPINEQLEYSDGIKIANSRIRNNFADGVNFCQGTSNAVVYNCSIRNNGDDGLAIWNNNWYAKDESNNVFCYNTIDFIWRAGGIAVYGGNGHKIYNNYIADTFMASGIHVNTVFPGYKFLNNDNGIVFSNNIIVRSGTYSDSGKTDMGAVDIMYDVRNVTFNNTYIYDAQHDAVRIMGSPSDIVFNNLNVYGTGLDGQTTSRTNKGSLFKFASKTTTQPVTVNGLNYSDIANADIFFGSRSDCKITNETNNGAGYEYGIPDGTVKTVGTVVPEKYEELPTEAPTETTTQAPTTTKPVTTTPAQTKKVTVKKTTVKKASKKKSSKKAKISLKKIKGASGYQVKISTSSRFKKSKTVTKKFKKATFTFKSSKIKNKKKLYVKARAYKKVKGKTYYSKWSNKKKIKIKK